MTREFELKDDGTLVVTTDQYDKVKRVLVEDGKHGTLFYAEDPCEDTISRADVLDLCDSKDPDYCVSYFKEDVECLPSVTPIQPKGEWLQVDDDADAFDCSKCGRMYSRKYNYCPNCGCDMREGNDADCN